MLAFNATLAGLEPEDFISHLLVERLGISGAVIGFDFHFGRNRKGTPELLKAEGERLGVAVDVVGAVSDAKRRFSSGAVRAALTAGDVTDAADILGYPWFVSGEVIHGEKRGRDLGFPTANIRLDQGCGLRHGIYAVRVGLGEERFDGVASFGRRPTFDKGAPLLEVFLFVPSRSAVVMSPLSTMTPAIITAMPGAGSGSPSRIAASIARHRRRARAAVTTPARISRTPTVSHAQWSVCPARSRAAATPEATSASAVRSHAR